MKTWERRIAPLGFFLAGVLFIVAAVIPTFRDQPLNAAFIPLGIVFGILGMVTWRKVQRTVSPPAD
jgi:hypothetical protein